LLVTSRTPLGIQGEVLFEVEPLAVPDGAADMESPATRLFTDRARAVRLGYSPDHEPDAVAHLVTRLDGIPLAIELAASRMRSFTPTELLTHLDDGVGLLEGARADNRHRTLDEAIAWSYELLQP